MESKLPQAWPNKDWFGTGVLLNYSTCFGRPSYPSSGVHKTVVAASGADHTIWGANFKCDVRIWSRLRKLASQII